MFSKFPLAARVFAGESGIVPAGLRIIAFLFENAAEFSLKSRRLELLPGLTP